MLENDMNLDDDEDDEDDVDRSQYVLSRQDMRLLAAARSLLEKMLRSSQARPAELVSVAKLLHAIDRLPNVTDDLNVEVSVGSPTRRHGEIETDHYWEVKVEDGCLRLACGGNYVHPRTGHDSFTTMIWEIYPGGEADFSDYLSSLGPVPDASGFESGVAGVDFTQGGYSIDISDGDNPLLEQLDEEELDDGEKEPEARSEFRPAMPITQIPTVSLFFDFGTSVGEVESSNDDDDAEDEEDDDNGADSEDKHVEFSVTPVDAAESALARQIDHAEVHRQEPVFAFGAKRCDACGTPLDSRGLYVDGKLKDGNGWANLCVPCFKARGVGIAWGRSQLYARQPDGRWRLVAGFAPPD